MKYDDLLNVVIFNSPSRTHDAVERGFEAKAAKPPMPGRRTSEFSTGHASAKPPIKVICQSKVSLYPLLLDIGTIKLRGILA